MKKAIFIICVWQVLMSFSKSQEYQSVRWWMLQDVSFEDVYNEELGGYYQRPTFGERVKKLDGQKIEISGYVIPVDISADVFVLSAYPFSSCFFCGGAGPESVMELEFSKDDNTQFKTDDYLTFQGVFTTNSKDITRLNYILKNTKQVE